MSISCVICGGKLERAGVCPRCGCDLSQCRERYPTLADDGHTPPSISAILSQRFEQLSAAQAAAQAAIVQRETAQSNERQPDAAPSSAAAYSVRQSEAAAPNAVEHGVRDPEAAASPAVNPRTRKGRAKVFLLAAAAVLVLVLGGVFLLPKLTESRTLLGSGTCGEAVTWELYDDGRLIINGSGEMTSSPWTEDEYRDRVVKAKIGSGVTGVGWCAFYDCGNMSSITIPNSVTSIGDGAFWGCSGLSSITIPDSVTTVGVKAFEGCSSLSSITIPKSVTSIDYDAFCGCISLSSITIPDSVTSIRTAFSGCTGLNGIQVSKDNPSYCDLDGVLFSKSKEELIAFPGGKGGEYAVPVSVTIIGEGAFSGCSGLSLITIPNSVTCIEDGVFFDCSSLRSITIPDSVTSIGDYAFHMCSGLSSIIIPDSVTSISDYAFLKCSGLSSITIPSSVTGIGNGAFSGCTSLTDVYYRGTQEQWSKISIGDGNSELTNADIHYNSN